MQNSAALAKALLGLIIFILLYRGECEEE